MRLKKYIKPVDVGIWDFWMRDTTREDTAIYRCRRCDATVRSNPQMLPDTCPFCDYEKLDDLAAGLFVGGDDRAW